VILFQATALSLLGGAEARKITLGLSLSTLPAEENRSITGQDAKRGLQFFVEWINGKGGIVVANETVRDFVFLVSFGRPAIPPALLFWLAPLCQLRTNEFLILLPLKSSADLSRKRHLTKHCLLPCG
jgi:hypothetical protein